jgi:hypothetical protein
MKRSAVILFSFYYLLLTSGLVVQTHYCGGKISSVALFAERTNPCPCGPQPAERGCCHHSAKLYKTENSFKPADISLPRPSWPDFEPVSNGTIAFFHGFAAQPFAPRPGFLVAARSWPPIALFLLFRVFRN